MTPTSHLDLREAFLSFFEERQHKRISSSSLIPQSDPTLLFANAGMNQFKAYFVGDETADTARATTSQKCVRAGGKHNDLENVGYTARHHTFFEMLGNFSFGDYFKQEAIEYAWDFLTNVTKLDKEKLWITVFYDDDDARTIWRDSINVPADRILDGDEKDNFWSMGDTGPCGPCSEIHYDQGPGDQWNCDDPDQCGVFCECDRYLEIWNLVFMQYNRNDDGSQDPLPKPSVDTGMGLERLAAVVNGKTSNYDTDLFAAILRKIGEVLSVSYGADQEISTAMRVIADHCRAATFLISDGILPDNEGRGYVLRRIMRRAIRYGRKIGATKPFLAEICRSVVEEMATPFPDLKDQLETVIKIVTLEEERFGETLDRGLQLFENALDVAREQNRKTIPGEVIFRLYDTYGFPVDLTQLLAREANIQLDMEGFDTAMEEQRSKARAAGKAGKSTSTQNKDLFDKYGRTHFVGYDALSTQSKIVGVVNGTANEGSNASIIVDTTPFYAESGGQTADRGEISWDGGRATVGDVQKAPGGVFVHDVHVEKGALPVGGLVQLSVNETFRQCSAAHHTATHMLQAALRETLGSHVRQAGSLVESDRLRFDFSHFSGLSKDEKLLIEDRINQKIRENIALNIKEMAYDDAIAKGAMAFFGEKYGNEVRVVDINGFSVELCGGTHVASTGQIGAFFFDAEGSVSAGVRRVEALVGHAAINRVRDLESNLVLIADKLNVPKNDLVRKIDTVLETLNATDKELQNLKQKMAGETAGDLIDQVQDIGPYRVLATAVSAQNPGELRDLSDKLKDQLGDVVIFLASGDGDRPSLFVSIPDAARDDLHAGNLLRTAAEAMDARGGGKPGSAQGGGGDATKIPHALDVFRSALAN